MHSIKQTRKYFNKDMLIIALLALLVATYIFFLLPAEIQFSNYRTSEKGLLTIATSSAPYLSICFLLLVAPSLVLRHAHRPLYTKLLLLLLSVLFVNSEFLYGDYGTFDGRGLKIKVFSKLTYMQIATILLASYTLFRWKVVEKFILFCLPLFILVSFSVKAMTKIVPHSRLVMLKPTHYKDLATFSKENKNYLFIILDEVYGGSAKDIFDQNDGLRSKYEGFTHYTNTSAVFPTTIMSVPAMLTGEVYSNREDVQTFYRNSFSSSMLLNKIHDEGYVGKFHAHTYHCSHIGHDICSNMGSMGMNFTKMRYYEALNIAFFKAVPDFLKRNVYRKEKWLFKTSDEFYVGRFIKEFDFFLENMKVSKESPATFKLFHSMLTHSPIKQDGSCVPINPAKPTYNNYLDQDKCGFIQVARILDKLKELGVYDNTYIIVSSDHGREIVNPDAEEAFLDTSIPKNIYGQSHAFLMIKPFDSHESCKTSHEPRSLLDISSIFVSAMNNETYNSLEKRVYTHYLWSAPYWDWGQTVLPPFENIYLINGDITDPENWRENVDDILLIRAAEIQ